MELKPRLIDVDLPERPAGVVLLLHGGASRRENMMVSPTQLSVLRMVPIARRVVRAGRGRLAVFRLLNSVRGWDAHHTPVRDAAWALAQIADRYVEHRPTCLIGHSLGGRAAILTAGRPEVRSVVALAPWVYPSDVPPGLCGQRILIVHGAKDRIAGPARSEALARELGRRARVAYVSIEDGKHAMLGRHDLFDGLAAEFAAATLLGRPLGGPLARVEAGEAWIRL
ncbi:MAG: alpha/beta hydrolase [Solirubrobacteraceae bacterium]